MDRKDKLFFLLQQQNKLYFFPFLSLSSTHTYAYVTRVSIVTQHSVCHGRIGGSTIELVSFSLLVVVAASTTKDGGLEGQISPLKVLNWFRRCCSLPLLWL